MSKTFARRIAFGAIVLCVAISGLVCLFKPEAVFTVAITFAGVAAVSLIAYAAFGDTVAGVIAGGGSFAAASGASIACAFGAASSLLVVFAAAVGAALTVTAIMFANEMINDRFARKGK